MRRKQQEEDRQREAEHKRQLLLEEFARNEPLHEAFVASLDDDFGILSADLRPHIKSLSFFTKQNMAEKYAGGRVSVAPGKEGLGHLAGALLNAPQSYRQGAISASISNGGHYFVSRPVSELHEKEVAALKILSLFHLHGMIKLEYFEKIKLAITFNNGNCQLELAPGIEFKDSRTDELARGALMELAQQTIMLPQKAVQSAMADISVFQQNSTDPEFSREISQLLTGKTGWHR